MFLSNDVTSLQTEDTIRRHVKHYTKPKRHLLVDDTLRRYKLGSQFYFREKCVEQQVAFKRRNDVKLQKRETFIKRVVVK